MLAVTPATDSPVLGNEIRRLRQDAGFSQQRLATEAGIGMSTLNRAERSDAGVTYTNIAKIARVLGVDPSAIYHDAPQATGYQGIAVAPAWAQQQHEQVTTALGDLRSMLRRLEDNAREIRLAIDGLSGA